VPLLVVHVTGAVAHPGVYRLAASSRTEDAIALAGGLAEGADPASLNLAARLVDGQQVNVRAKVQPVGESAASAAAEAKPIARLNLNSASLADLDALPGLGPALAQRVVERRQRSGPYQAVEQLRDERILPAATYERIKDLVTLDP
jgi:competence protein ComEA